MSLGRVGEFAIHHPSMVWVSWEMENTEEGLGNTRLLMLAVQPTETSPVGHTLGTQPSCFPTC